MSFNFWRRNFFSWNYLASQTVSKNERKIKTLLDMQNSQPPPLFFLPLFQHLWQSYRGSVPPKQWSKSGKKKHETWERGFHREEGEERFYGTGLKQFRVKGSGKKGKKENRIYMLFGAFEAKWLIGLLQVYLGNFHNGCVKKKLSKWRGTSICEP